MQYAINLMMLLKSSRKLFNNIIVYAESEVLIIKSSLREPLGYIIWLKAPAHCIMKSNT